MTILSVRVEVVQVVRSQLHHLLKAQDNKKRRSMEARELSTVKSTEALPVVELIKNWIFVRVPQASQSSAGLDR